MERRELEIESVGELSVGRRTLPCTSSLSPQSPTLPSLMPTTTSFSLEASRIKSTRDGSGTCRCGAAVGTECGAAVANAVRTAGSEKSLSPARARQPRSRPAGS